MPGIHTFTRWVPFAFALMLSGCGALTRTVYTTPRLAVPTHWQTDSAAWAKVSADPWWHAFGDTVLDGLVDRMMKGNQQLAGAVASLKGARYQADLVWSYSALPIVEVSGSTSVGRTFRSSQGIPPTTSHSNSTYASINYQVDLWGSQASNVDAAGWEAQATEQDRENLVLQLVGSTLSTYWQMAYVSRQLEQNEQSIKYTRKLLAIARTRYLLGAISANDRLSAEQALAQQEADKRTLLDQKESLDNAMSLLLGNPPGERYVVPAAVLDRSLPVVAAGIPADVLGRRPDLRAAEMRLRELLDQADAARTNFYPTLTLTGYAGSTSATLHDLLVNPVGTLVFALAVPAVNFWQIGPTVGVARSNYESAIANFRQTFYQALQDVENALAARDHDTQRADLLAKSLKLQKQIELRKAYAYEVGAIPLETLLDEQEQSRQLATSLAEARYQQLVNQVKLYQALGGS